MPKCFFPCLQVRNKDQSVVRALRAVRCAQGSFRFGAFSAFRIENGGYIHSTDCGGCGPAISISKLSSPFVLLLAAPFTAAMPSWTTASRCATPKCIIPSYSLSPSSVPSRATFALYKSFSGIYTLGSADVISGARHQLVAALSI